jgi:starch synthase
VAAVSIPFWGGEQTVDLFEVAGQPSATGVRHWVAAHPVFRSYDAVRGRYRIYVDDPPDRPFAGDATKYAFFCLAVAEALRRQVFGPIDRLHLHDWHSALLLFLRRFHPAYRALQAIRSVYTIHNLAHQGVRPLHGHESSLGAWYPDVHYPPAAVCDPRWGDCVNPMAVGIRLADAVHTVSPTYAREILERSDKPRFYGGEGLEGDLRAAETAGRLFGILNGCEYPSEQPASPSGFPQFIDLLRASVLRWSGDRDVLPASHFLAHARLSALAERADRPGLLVTGVGRAVEQKVFLLRPSGSDGPSALEGLLTRLAAKGVLILLGTGEAEYERFFTRMSAGHENFIFLNGYSDACAAALYSAGDLFLMPSSYEPCGISQMLAMREGQPCLVHAIGGLEDTVRDGRNGFTFAGETVRDQVDNFLKRFSEVVALKNDHPDRWRGICKAAAAARFHWDDTVHRYLTLLYGRAPDR